MSEVADQWAITYADEAGSSGKMPVKFRDDLHQALRRTDRGKVTEATVDRIVVWLATAILSHATMTAAKDDPEDVFTEWVSMDDSHVRESHKDAAGQIRPVGEKYAVGDVKMWGPGDPSVPIEYWVNCRCTLRPVLASEALVAAVGQTDQELTDKIVSLMTEREEVAEPTHAGFAVIAADSGRILMLQRTWDETDDEAVRGTWEFPGGGIEEGETPEEAARREFTEETGLAIPAGEVTNGWRSEDGVYQGFVYTVAVESEAFAEINPDQAAAEVANPDDPDRRNPDVTAWFTIEQVQNLGPALRPEVANTDWSVFGQQEEEVMTDPAPEVDPDLLSEDPEKVKPALSDVAVPWYGVLAPEDVRSGDGRGFKTGSLSTRPLPLPLTWQKTSAEGHLQSVTVAKIEQAQMVGGEMRGSGHFLLSEEADQAVGLIGDFGKFGVSVDADDADFDLEGDVDTVWFSKARVCGASIVGIPAFAEAWVALGEPPADWFSEGTTEEEGEPLPEIEDDEEEALVAAAFAPGTQDGPGWLTHPVDTDRLRDYWVSGKGAAEIAWGTPGDFNRCRVATAQYIKPQHLNGYCANRHFDALGVWPGQETVAANSLKETPMSNAVNLVASGGSCAPSEWFEDPKFAPNDGRMVEFEGVWGAPMTITEEGRVFGHVATWKSCHRGPQFADVCQTAPHSASNYAQFLLGAVLTDKGLVATGNLTIGGGHAGPRLSARAAMAHYDSTSTVFADVRVGEDEFGIWFAGWVRPGTPDEMVHAARASKLSGDWRKHGVGLELVAALAVNVPGFAIPRMAASVQQGDTFSLVAAGVVPDYTEPVPAGFDMEALAASIVQRIEARQALAALRAEVAPVIEAGLAAATERRRAEMAKIREGVN
jgi:8-oxo-dGTP pyrophosphatase MutT (NUDIX family)